MEAIEIHNNTPTETTNENLYWSTQARVGIIIVTIGIILNCCATTFQLKSWGYRKSLLLVWILFYIAICLLIAYKLGLFEFSY